MDHYQASVVVRWEQTHGFVSKCHNPHDKDAKGSGQCKDLITERVSLWNRNKTATTKTH